MLCMYFLFIDYQIVASEQFSPSYKNTSWYIFLPSFPGHNNEISFVKSAPINLDERGLDKWIACFLFHDFENQGRDFRSSDRISFQFKMSSRPARIEIFTTSFISKKCRNRKVFIDNSNEKIERLLDRKSLLWQGQVFYLFS